MTHGILRANSLPLEKIPSLEGYASLGFFYDHKLHTAGFVFSGKKLEDFVSEHACDPVTINDAPLPKNYADIFAEELDILGTYLVIPRPHRKGIHQVIADNYDLFEVYEKKTQRSSDLHVHP